MLRGGMSSQTNALDIIPMNNCFWEREERELAVLPLLLC